MLRPTCRIGDKPRGAGGARERAPAFAPHSGPAAKYRHPHPFKSVQREHALTVPGHVDIQRPGVPGFGLRRDGLRPRGGCRPHTPEPRPAIPERARLRQQQRPPCRFRRRERAAFRAVQRAGVQCPARPVPRQCAQVAQAQDAQQPDHRPRHPAAPGFPVSHGAQADAEKVRRRLPAQQAGPAQLAEAFRADVPQAPGGLGTKFASRSGV